MSDIVASIAESRDIAASTSRIFLVLATPSMHPHLDGTGMAQSADTNDVLTKVGDVFVLHMKHWSLGDYGMENHVVEFVQDQRIVWQPVRHTYQSAQFDAMLADDAPPEVRYWGWELEPLAPNLTRVTEFYDARGLSEGLREFLKNGEFWRQGMRTSLENLERLVTHSATPDANNDVDAALEHPRNYYEEVQRSRW